MLSPLARYKNGNYYVRIFDDGTKERFTPEDEFIPAFPESIDLKITDYCDVNCPMCHENSSINGVHGELSTPFIDTLPSGVELAIGGGNALAHPDLESFLIHLKERGIIANMTVNERHLLLEMERLSSYMEKGLIHGLGISLSLYDEKTFEFAKTHPNSVLHFIVGIVDSKRLLSVPKGLKALLLGYKKFGRGESYFNKKIEDSIEDIKDNFQLLFTQFSHIAFDNLALTQLEVKENIPARFYARHFMGDDGEFTMYIDLVKKQFATSSTSKDRYSLKDDIQSMFQDIRQKRR